MKHLILFFFMMTASSVFAESFKCSEGSETALQENRLQYSVFINQVNEIKNPDIIKENDRAAYVLVSVLSRNPKVGGPFKLNRPTFGAVAVMADVMFFITDKKHGFQPIYGRIERNIYELKRWWEEHSFELHTGS
jgi:hypothetical protein